MDRIHTNTTEGQGGEKSSAAPGKKAQPMRLLLAACFGALLVTGCNQSSPVGVYTYSRAGTFSTINRKRVEPIVTFVLDLRANGSYVSTIEGAVRETPTAIEGDLPSGRGTWVLRNGSVILFSGEEEVGRLLTDGLDLINVKGSRYTRVRWLSDDRGSKSEPGDS